MDTFIDFINRGAESVLTEQDIRAARELLAIARSVCHEAPRVIVIRPAGVVRAIVRRVVLRLPAARSAIESAVARLLVSRNPARSGIPVSGFL